MKDDSNAQNIASCYMLHTWAKKHCNSMWCPISANLLSTFSSHIQPHFLDVVSHSACGAPIVNSALSTALLAMVAMACGHSHHRCTAGELCTPDFFTGCTDLPGRIMPFALV